MIEIKELSYSLDGKEIFNKVSAKFSPGQIITVSGHSGSGKSMLLSILQGLKLPSSGDVLLSGTSAICFQVPALISNLTVELNLLLALDVKFPTMSLREKVAIINDALNDYDLYSKKGDRPAMLSLGQQYLVALIRSFIFRPANFLWDEPFVNIDEAYHDKINDQLNRLIEEKSLVVFFTNRKEIVKCYGQTKFIIEDRVLKNYEI